MQLIGLKKEKFVLDAYDDVAFEGYTSGELWNGFECPLFPLESAQRIAQTLAEEQTAFYDESADEFVFAEEDYADDPDRYGAIVVEGMGKLYPIGTRVWTWGKE